MDDHLLPHGSTEPVGEVVHLVDHDVAEAGQGLEPAYSMFRSTSVVITTTGASPLTLLSPVSSPTFARTVPPHEIVRTSGWTAP